MSFIVFNTIKKAEHYVKYCNSQVRNRNYDDDEIHYYISDNKVIKGYYYIWYCGSSEPENGYICCSDSRCESVVIGRIKNF